MGDNPSASAYTQRLRTLAETAGVSLTTHALAADAPEDAVRAALAALNADPAIDAILPLLPFGPHLPPSLLAETLAPAKDVDGLSVHTAGRLSAGLETLAPCTPQAALALAESCIGDFKGCEVTIVGASRTVGQPLALMLMRREATVTIAQAATRDLVAACRGADVLFVAAGRPHLIGPAHIKPGAVVIDIGINAIDAPERGPGQTRIVGDVDTEAVAPIARAVSVAPDGVGPITSAILMTNSIGAAWAEKI